MCRRRPLACVVRLPVHPLAEMPLAEAAEQVTPEVTPEVGRLLAALDGDASRQELQQALNLKDDEHFRKAYLQPALEAGLIERTILNKPRSSRQRYRLTPLGEHCLLALREGERK